MICMAITEAIVTGISTGDIYRESNFEHLMQKFLNYKSDIANYGTSLSVMFLVFISYYYISMRYTLKNFTYERSVDFVNTLNRLFFFEIIAVAF